MKDQKDIMIEKFQREEQKAKKRMFRYISIPLILTAFLIVVSIVTVERAGRQVRELKNQSDSLETTVANLNQIMILKNDSLTEMKKIMELALTYKDKRFEFDFSRDKELFSRYPRQANLIEEMRRMIDGGEVKWHLGGYSPETGFDSPSFATYMINKYSKTKIEERDRYNLREILPSTTQPGAGDVVFYEGGYAMFYFKYHNQPFVIGMTPVGLTSLTFDFGPKYLGFGKVNY